jgi:hypothetical protein
MHRSKRPPPEDSGGEEESRLSEACPNDGYVSMKEELEKIASNPKSKIEQKCEASLSYLKKHLRFAAYQTLLILRESPEEKARDWFDLVLSIAEKISFLEDTEPILPLHPDGFRGTFHNIGGVTKNRPLVEMFWEVKEHRRRWKEADQLFHAEIAFLQREAADPYYKLDLERECYDLCARRGYFLKKQLDKMREWEETGASITHFSLQTFQVQEELRGLNSERLMDRVRVGLPVLPGEIATDLNWEQIPQRKWPKPKPEQIIELLVNLVDRHDEEKHVTDPEVVAKHALWTKQYKRHQQRVRNLRKVKEDLKAEEELHYRVALRIQKRSAELREEAATLKEWLASGHLHSVYAYRFVDIQVELRNLTCENLIEKIEEVEEEDVIEEIK